MRDAARHREVGRRDERLDLEQDRPRPLERAGDRRRRSRPAACLPKSSDGIGHADEPVAGHLEDAELVGRAEAVLRRAQDAMRVVAVALELEHAVDEVLEHPRACDGAVLRDVADEDRRDARLLRRRGGRRPAASRTCADRARRGADARRRRASGPSRSRRRRAARVSSVAQTASSSVSARISTSLGAAEPRGAQLHLRGRLLAGDEERAPARREIAPSAVRSSVDLPTPGSPPTRTRLAARGRRRGRGRTPAPRSRSASPPRRLRRRGAGAAWRRRFVRRRLRRLLDERTRTRRSPGTCRTTRPAE